MVDLNVGCLTCFQPSDLNAQLVRSTDSIQDALRKHFWFTEDDLQQAQMCQSCCEQVTSFYLFYISVEELYQNQTSYTIIVKPEPGTDGFDCPEEALPECSSIKLDVETEQLKNLNTEYSLLSDIASMNADGIEYIGTDDPLTESLMKEKSYQDISERKRVKKLMSQDDRIKEHVKYICEQCGYECDTFSVFRDHNLQRHNNKSPFLVCCGKKYRRRKVLFQHVQHIKNPDMLRCQKCKKKFKDWKAYRCHKDVCHASGCRDRIFDCDQCPRSFAIQHLFKAHMENHAGYWKCEKCDEKFVNGTRLKKHVTQKHPELPLLTCDVCSEGFRINSLLQKHKQRHEQQQCQLCPSMLQDRKSLRAHARIMHPDAMVCYTCKQVLPTRAALQSHKIQEHRSRGTHDHQQNLSFEANDCDCPSKIVDFDKKPTISSIVVKEELVIEDPNEEIVQHEIEEDQKDSEQNVASTKRGSTDAFIRKHVKFICDKCGEESQTFKLFMNHALEKHDDQLAFVACCGKKFRTKYLLFQHVQTQNNPNLFRCEDCKTSFHCEQYFRRHMKHVHGSRRFKCDYCPKSFASKYILWRHRKNHLGDENLKCPYCETIFTAKQSLFRHVRRQHPDSPKFNCDVCSQKFSIESWLLEHKKKHKELQCLLCPQRFPFGKLLRAHVLKLHPGVEELPVMCTICRDVLPTKNALSAHRVQKHKRQHILADEKVRGELQCSRDYSDVETRQLESSIEVKEEQVIEERTDQLVQKIENQTMSDNTEDEMAEDDLHDSELSLVKQNRRSTEQIVKRLQDHEFHGRAVDVEHLDLYQDLRVVLTDCLKERLLEYPSKTDDHNKEQFISSIVVKEEHIFEDPKEVKDQPYQNMSESDHSQDKIEQDQHDSESALIQQTCNSKLKRGTKWRQMYDQYIRKHVKYICAKCGQESLTFKLFMSHALDIHDDKLAFVVCCGKKFRKQTLLFQHVQSLNNPNMFRCEDCNTSYHSKNYYRQHLKRVHGRKKFKCDYCPKIYSTKSMLWKHREGHLGEANLQCPHCDKSFSSHLKISRHVNRQHPDATKFVCDVCPQKFRMESTLLQHKLKHKELQCLLCPQRFSCGKGLRAHVLKKHPRAKHPMICTICRDVLPDKVALDAHKDQEHKRLIVTEQLNSSLDVEEEHVSEEQAGEIVQHAEIKTESGNFKHSMEEVVSELRLVKQRTQSTQQAVKRHNDKTSLRDQELMLPSKDALDALRVQAHKHPCNLTDACPDEISDNQLVSIIVKSETMVGDTICLEESLAECSYDKFVTDERREETINDGALEIFSADEKGLDPDVETLLKQQQMEDELIKTHVQYKCEHCGEESDTFVQLRYHVKRAHNAEFYVWCCNRKFPRKALLFEHVQFVNNPDLFRCKICSNRYASHHRLKRHIKKIHHPFETGKVKCFRCQKSFQDEDAYVTHLKGPGDTIGKCEHCEAVFTNCVEQDHHYRTMHHDAPKTICEVCCGEFFVKEWLMEHTLGHERNDALEGKFKCGLCAELFDDKSQRKMHVQDHAGWDLDSCWAQQFSEVSQYICHVCSKAFRTQQMFQQHSLKHVKPILQCPDCPLKFDDDKLFIAHVQASHQREKLFCKICQIGFSSLRAFHDHKVLEHGAKRHCRFCKKSFDSLERLEDHIATAHNQSKPHVCKVCGKGYVTKLNLSKHVMNEH